jgi:hypothetical protein
VWGAAGGCDPGCTRDQSGHENQLEHVDVKRDTAVPAAQALQAAHAVVLRNLVSSAMDDKGRAALQRLLAMEEKGESQNSVSTLRR